MAAAGHGDNLEDLDQFAQELAAEDREENIEVMPDYSEAVEGATHGVGVSGDDDRDGEERMTTRYMTKYERARILGTRALQLR